MRYNYDWPVILTFSGDYVQSCICEISPAEIEKWLGKPGNADILGLWFFPEGIRKTPAIPMSIDGMTRSLNNAAAQRYRASVGSRGFEIDRRSGTAT